MMKLTHLSTLIFTVALLTFHTDTNAQKAKSRTLKKVLELKIPAEQTSGSNGVGVAWHPLQKKYYTALGGNKNFGMSVFDANGKLLSSPELKAMSDLRGLWYNELTKTIQGNAFLDGGWLEYVLDSKGIPTGIQIIRKGKNQPDNYSVGAFNPKENAIYFFIAKEYGYRKYDYTTGNYEFIDFGLGAADKEEEDHVWDFYSDGIDISEEYNYSTMVYTGIPGAEVGVLNFEKIIVELYDIETGYKTWELKFPEGLNFNIYKFMNFSYANGMFWFFDKEKRSWVGLK
ncbi:MAG: hypothetical protein J5I50_12695 [Chitinophagaceae bacterium]|nr:hypothetical protein [Chitinophagaceae bacterium]